ncbi:MAG: CocE/NonD family hydrolase [Desulfobacterales bacterium]|nr:CocE/NonD family hydrolase [Desulfobacterales bacterium]
MKKIIGSYHVAESHTPPPCYDRPPAFDTLKQDRDVMVPMRDGVHLCVDIYRPDAPEKFPALLAIAPHNKDLQAPEAAEASGPQPAWSPLWLGAQEAGDTRFLVSRGYAHVIGNVRGVGKSEDGGSAAWDCYDLIEWIAGQPWCDGSIGMVGISIFAGLQWQAAMQQPPHLKAIFPYDAHAAYGERDRNPGGVIHVMGYLTSQLSVEHHTSGRPGPLPPELERRWQEALKNPDYRMYGHLYNVLTQKGQHEPRTFKQLLDPYDNKAGVERTEANFKRIKVPAYTGAGWYAYTYKTHLQGCQHWYSGIKAPKKMLFTGPAHLERPFNSFHSEILRWYDYWLKGIDTGIMDEPPVKMWVMGANAWYHADDWPVPGIKWTPYYLHSWERLREEPFTPSSRDSGYEAPDAFVQMPASQTRKVEGLRYMTDPLPEDILIAGPGVLRLYASIDQADTNWIIVLKDVGPDGSVRTAREGETFLPSGLFEREVTRGWLKASLRALDPERSKPWKPWHLLTRESRKPVVPGEINEYAVEILATANLFKKGHRICLEITSMDLPTGTAGFTNVEYIPYHVCSSQTTLHKIYHNEKYPSCLLLPVVLEDSPLDP